MTIQKSLLVACILFCFFRKISKCRLLLEVSGLVGLIPSVRTYIRTVSGESEKIGVITFFEKKRKEVDGGWWKILI